MKKATMRIETPMVALMLATMMFIGLFSFVFDIAEDNNVTPDLSAFSTQGNTSFYDSFEKFNETKTELDVITTDFEETTLDPTGLVDIFPFLALSFRTGIKLFQSLNILKDIFISMGDVMSIDPVFITIFITLFFIIFIVAVIMLLLGRTY